MNTNNSNEMMNGIPPIGKEERRLGPIIGALIIVLLIIVASLYFFGKRLNTENKIDNTKTVQTINTSSNTESTSSVESLQQELDSQLSDIDYSF